MERNENKSKLNVSETSILLYDGLKKELKQVNACSQDVRRL